MHEAKGGRTDTFILSKNLASYRQCYCDQRRPSSMSDVPDRADKPLCSAGVIDARS